jgi:outer membrane protein OmpA-like peptidoglycan-associated protein
MPVRPGLALDVRRARGAAVLTAVAVVLAVGTAAGDPTNDRCVAARTSARTLRSSGDLASARAQLVECIAPSCSRSVIDECVSTLTELDAALRVTVVGPAAGSSEAGVASDRGAPIPQPTIHFGSGRFKIGAESFPVLDGIVSLLGQRAGISLGIQGHSEDTEPGDGMTLSLARADAVRQYLVAHGVEIRRLRSVGYCNSQPIGQGDSESTHALERRAQLVPTVAPEGTRVSSQPAPSPRVCVPRRRPAVTPSGGGLMCNDGTMSPTCSCAGSHRGCCSWHGGVAGCQ